MVDFPLSGQHVNPERKDMIGVSSATTLGACYVGVDNVFEIDLDTASTSVYVLSGVIAWYAVIKRRPSDADADAISSAAVVVDDASQGYITLTFPKADFTSDTVGSAWWSLHAEGENARIPIMWGKVDIKPQATTT